MTRPTIPLALMLLLILQVGCGSVHKAYHGKAPEDVRCVFIGTWRGEHMDHEGKLLRTWIQNRFEDGTYTISFVHFTEEGAHRSQQEGRWWIDCGRFYEIAPHVMEEPDVYRFEIVSENEIRFKSVETDYEFTDIRMPDFHDATFI